MNFDTLLNRVCVLSQTQPDKLAVAFKKEQLTYAGLYKKILGISALLKKEGILPGDAVCFSAVSKPEMVATYLAIHFCGAVAVFLDKNSTPENMVAICQEAGAKLLLTDKPMKEFVESCNLRSLREFYQQAEEQDVSSLVAHTPAREELADLLFTTGTTGKPKGVMLTYWNVYHILKNTVDGIGILPEDRVLLPLPLNHSFALRVLRAILYQGGTVVLQNGFTFAKEVENNVAMYDCSAMAAVPASYEVMRGQMQDKFAEVLGKMRYIEFSAGSLSVRQRREIVTLLPNTVIHNTWGSSESGGAIFCNVTEVAKDERRIGSLGRPLPCVEAKIINPEGQTIESNAANPGRMALKGDMQMSGYWKRSDLTQTTLVDGWLLTGDMAYIDEDGFIFMLGRADDIINVGGEKVSPIEVENLAGQYQQIRECACIGVEDPDGVLGQVPILFVVTNPGYTEDALVKFLLAKGERYKLPKKFIQIEALPRNKMQKVDRGALKKLWDNQDQLELMNPVMHAILSRRSIRKFTEQEIPRPILDMILKAGYYAPSGHNMQSWRFTVLYGQQEVLRLKEIARTTAKENKVYFYGFENPRAIILISNNNRNVYGCQDASCAAQNIMVAAQSYGIGTVWLNPLMTLRDAEPVASLLDEYGVPRNHTVWAAIALGYPVSEGTLLAKKSDVIHFVGE